MPHLVGVVSWACVYMPTYELTKPELAGTLLEHTPAAGMVVGIASAVVRVPVSVVKSRLQLGQHQSTREAVTHAIKGGPGGIFVGLWATVVHDVVYGVVQFTCLRQMRKLALARSPPITRGAGLKTQRS